MEIKNLKLNRFLNKEAVQDDSTKNAQFAGIFPVPKIGTEDRGKNYQSKGNDENEGAPNILTGTVITSCFIQTTALPSRIELEGNDVTFYDDTFEEAGEVKGDTARLVFTHDLDSNEGFIIEKRASIHDTYDNVISWYATPAKTGRVNYMYIGRGGIDEAATRNVSYIEIAANVDTALPFSGSRGAYNGVAGFRMSIDGVKDDNAGIYIIYAGTAVSGKTGLAANLFGSGDGSSNDEGAAQVAYFENGVATHYISINKNGIQFFGLPTSSAGLPSKALWLNANVLTIVP